MITTPFSTTQEESRTTARNFLTQTRQLMRRLTQFILLVALIGGVMASVAPPAAKAMPIRELTTTVSPFGLPFITVADINVKVFDAGVTTGDDRFALLPSLPGPDDFTYLYNIVERPGSNIQFMNMPLPSPLAGFDTVVSAGIIDGNNNVTVLPDSSIDESSGSPSIFFNLTAVQGSEFDLFIISPFGPGDESIFVGANFTLTPGGAGQALLIAPDDNPHPTSTSVPEPSRVLLLGFGFLALGALAAARRAFASPRL